MHWLKIRSSIFKTQSATLALVMLLGSSTLLAAESRAQTQAELEAVNNAIATIQNWLRDAQASYSTEETSLREAELDVTAISRNIAALQSQLASTGIEQDKLQQEMRTLEAAKSQQSALLAQLLRAAYMRGDQSLLKLLLNQEDLGEAGRMLQYYRVYTRAQLDALQLFQSTLDTIETTNSQLQATARTLSAQQADLQHELHALELARQTRASALQQLENSISARNAELEQLQIDQMQLQQLVTEIGRAVEQIPIHSTSTSLAARRGQLSLPIAGVLQESFGARYGDGNLRRQGILIAASPGTPVRAVHGGQVVFADWLRGAGLLIIINHGDGYMSLYGNNQALAKRAGEQVIAGEVVATSETAYFEIRQHGTALDPADWLQAGNRSE